jgi:UDP:flavonoid glycosyltransferase YjiC (YdhE family)
MPIAIAGLRKLDIPLMVATAGRVDPARLEPPILAAKFLPGSDAAKRASFVVCNGGSSTAYQALAQGRPVLGIASNLDQYLAMTAVRDAGAGILLRADSLTPEKVEAAGRTLIEDTKYQLAARRVARALRSYDCAERFGGVLRELGA